MSNLDQQINAICDVLARDPGFVATQDAMHQSKRAGEAARVQAALNNPDVAKQISMQAGPLKKTALQECGEWHARWAGRLILNGNTVEANTHLKWSVACFEANEQ